MIELYGMYEYANVVRHVIETGVPRAPRGLTTLDAGHVTVVLHDPRQGLAVGCGRGLSPRVAATEAVQLIGAFHDPDLMLWSSHLFGAFQDEPHQAFHGAYGYRIADQLAEVTRKLREDPDTRQAVITLWRPELDNEPGHRDYPCTIALGFTLGRHGLNMNVVMRSNDVWLGFPYDVFQFTQLQLTLARVLGVEVGTYTHTAWSMHFYETNYAGVAKLRVPYPKHRAFQPLGLDGRFAAKWVYEEDTTFKTDPTETEMWYHAQFAGFRQSRRAAAELG